ncbi:MAG TPA: FtsH protease activity modulator HflK [Pirellulales bacterium]|nr:FtsH protease activity modulator HflK [Pirellulales bacterium]
MKRLAAFGLLALLAWLATGIYFVQPDEQAVVRRFGAVVGPLREPGAHLGLPWGLDRVERVKPREVKRVTIGAVAAAGEATGAQLPQFFTGDRNLVGVRATVQYTIKRPQDFLFQTLDVDRLAAAAGAAALSKTLAEEPVDRVLTLGKHDLGVRVAEQLQTLVDRYSLGITIRSVDIGAIAPPAEVADAFDRVVSALRQREQTVNQAHSFANKTLAEAKGGAQRLVDVGVAERDRAIRRAQGETDRFLSLLAEYEQSPELTAERLYLDTMAETLPKLRSKLIVDSDSDVDLSILPKEPQK